MERHETVLPGVWELRPRILHDVRGFFVETYDRRKFADMGIRDCFVQDDYSCSSKGTLRGLHYQIKHPQAKLCRVVGGEAFDVAVDIRVGSPYFGKWVGILLRAEDQNQVYIPAGFAHGFLALTGGMQFEYKCSDFYDPADEGGVLWSDPHLGIPWGVTRPLLSEKDAKLRFLSDVPLELLPRYQEAP